MSLGKYGVKVKTNMEENYPLRFQDLIMDGTIMDKLYERERQVKELKEIIEEQWRKAYPKPKSNEFLIKARYNQMIENFVEQDLVELIEEKI